MRPRTGFKVTPMNKSFRDSNFKLRKKAIEQFEKSKDLALSYGFHGIPEKCIPTGIHNLDIISGQDKYGGFGVPISSILAITGNPSDGKTSLLSRIMANAQKEGMIAYPIDVEGLLSKDYMQTQGVDTDDLIVDEEPPKTLQEAYDNIRNILRATTVPVVIGLDSMSAMQTKEESELDSIGDEGSRAGHARVNSKALRILTPLVIEKKSILVIIAQSKADMGFGKHAGAKTFIGGKPVKFHASLVYDIARTSWIYKAKKTVGMECRILIAKSKVGIPYRNANNLVMDFATGFDNDLALHEALVDMKMVKKEGNTYEFFEKTKSGDTINYVSAKGIKKLDPKVKAFLEQALYKKAARGKG